MEYSAIGQRTFLELISEVQDIINSKRYDIPELIATELKAARITISAANESFIEDMLNTLSLFLLPLEDKINSEDVDFFKRLEVCKACEPENDHHHECICILKCKKKCNCSPSCVNCSDILKMADLKTFNAIKFIINQAVDGGEEEYEDIHILFEYLQSITALVKNHKKR
jgi:hypothetical protein